MDLAIEYDFNVEELKSANRFRIFMQCIRVTDILNVKGAHFLDGIMNCETPVYSNLTWPKERNPGLGERKHWK